MEKLVFYSILMDQIENIHIKFFYEYNDLSIECVIIFAFQI